MKKTLVKWLALSLALCCLIPLFAGCSIFEDKVTRTAKKILTGGNYTMRVSHNDEYKALMKVGDGIVRLDQGYEYLYYYDLEAETYRAYTNMGATGWTRGEIDVGYISALFVGDPFSYLQLYLNMPDLFIKSDDGKSVSIHQGDESITIQLTKSGLDVKIEWPMGKKTSTQLYSFTNIGKTKVDIPDAIK